MIETIITIQNQQYPFEELASKAETAKVEDIQTFHSARDLLQKKDEMQKKNKLINSPYLIRMVKIYQQDLSLHFIYEHVPYSLSRYIKKAISETKAEGQQLNSKLFLKKVSYQLMMLISYLVSMRIQVQLAVQNIGFTYDDKLKLYMNAKCKMGHKTELSLLANYNASKEKILDYIQQELETLKRPPQEQLPNFIIKGNKLLFPQTTLNESIYESNNESFRPEKQSFDSNFNSCQSGIFNSSILNSSNLKSSAASCIHESPRPSFLRQTQSPKFTRNFNLSQAKNSARSSRKAKNHKNSFQFGGNAYQNQRPYTEADDNSDAKSFTHSRSIRIQFEQKNNPNQKKQRKDSYKVKVTSFHEYQMDDCDPQELLGKNPEGGDFFQYIAKQARNYRKKNQEREGEDDEDEFEQCPPVFMRKQSMPENGYAATSVSSARDLQEKVRIAKEKASNLLNKYMKAKKMSSFGH